jgi:hypothetical protein
MVANGVGKLERDLSLHADKLGVEIWSDAAISKGTGAYLGFKAGCTAAMSLPVDKRHGGKDFMFLSVGVM